MTADVAARTHGTNLTIRDDQTGWDEKQVAGLRHLGLSNATPGDLSVFFHVVKRSGLDPFARQIHMIERRQKDRNGKWISKWTIQIGIDGFRAIGHRAANRDGHTVAVHAPQWAHPDGGWRDVWSALWGVPLAARVTIDRNGEPFTAVALYEEYLQTKSDGSITHMWASRPAGMLAKCAEALAWRMAFPQDLSGMYSEEEMARAQAPVERQARVTVESLRAEPVEAVDAEVVEDEPLDLAPMWEAIAAAGIPKGERAEFIAQFLGREITGPTDLSVEDVAAVIAEAHTLTGGDTDAHDD